MSLSNVCFGCGRVWRQLKQFSSISFRVHYSTDRPSHNLPVISFPVSTKNRIIRRVNARKKSNSKFSLGLAQPGKIYISSSDRKESLFVHDYYTKFNPPKSTMELWTSRKSPGKYLKIHAIQENPSKNTTSTFSDILGSEILVNSLEKIKVKRPTVVQDKAIPTIFKGKNVLFAAETGSGKTWAYLLPIMKRILEKKEASRLTQDGPTSIVLVPTKELCVQVTSMGRALGLDGINFLALTSTIRSISDWDFDRYFPNVLVATPASLISAIYKNLMNFTSVEHLVVDECDTMLDESFIRETIQVIKRFNIVDGTKQPLTSEHLTTQLIMCSATFPPYAEDHLQQVIDVENMEKVRTGYLHRIPTHVTHRFLRVKPSEKLEMVVKEVEKWHHQKQIIVFCNRTSSCYQVARACIAAGVPVSRCDGNMPSKERRYALQGFLSQKTNVLITTDLLSRGLNTPNVDHVINYEVPSQTSDYLHRSGRVGRVDSTNKNADVTTYVSRKYEIDILKEIEDAARKRTELRDVDANIKKRHRLRWESVEEERIDVSSL